MVQIQTIWAAHNWIDMLKAVHKLVLIPVLALSTGFFISMVETTVGPQMELYPEHLAGAFTGGFGEETCHSCHFDYDLNWEEGNLSVYGIPDVIEENRVYEFEIIIQREDLMKAGFQLSARYADGSQAGTFQLDKNDRVMFTQQVLDSLQYLQHSKQGILPLEDGENRWDVVWKSPELIPDTIHFHIAANAANGDQSEFGDWIYKQSFKVNKKSHE